MEDLAREPAALLAFPSDEPDASQAAHPAAHRIYLTTVGGNQLSLDLQAGDTVRSVKEKLWDVSGLHVYQQHLLRDGIELKDKQMLSSFPQGAMFSLLASAPKQVRVYVEGSGCGMICVHIAEAETVKHLKNKIWEVTPVSWDRHDLQFQGKLVDDDKTLIDHLLIDGSGVQLVVQKPAWAECFRYVFASLCVCALIATLLS